MPIFTAPDGTRLAYRLVGEGEPLICLPGGALRASDHLGELGGLGAHRQLVLLDPRGTGDPEVPADPATDRRGEQVADVEALREHLGLDAVDVLAHSAGAGLALRHAAAHPRRVRGLALIAPRAQEAGVVAGAGDRPAAAGPDVPVLVLAGELDEAPDPATAARIAALFPRGETAVLPGAGHVPWLDDPGGFVRTVAAFLDPAVRNVRMPAGYRLACRTWGDPAAPPVLLLHGRTMTGADWTDVAEALAATRRVYAPDLRGHGLSDRPGGYTYGELAEEVRTLLDVLGLDRVDLVGHSMGAAVAYQVAQTLPGRVGRMVLEDPLPPFPVDPPRPPEPRPAPEEIRALAFDWELIPDTDEGANHPDPAWAADLARITAPTLVLSGGPESFLAEADVRRTAELIPGARAVTIPVGHLIHRGDPEGFLAELKAFGIY
ncbi:alpha/beta fold hydrolase [Streptomyces sp. NPDC004111]|uniref:alpha/beta fold hydrolase n=1 Tax=Streptomyces sp. NPDC004111 TaxID=3364690 RepID=UPI0036A0A199